MSETILEGVFINVPTYIITDILARLPPNAVIQCRCVCKAWLKLISEPEFVNLHLSKSPTCMILHKYFPWYQPWDSFSLVEVEDETDHHGVRPIAGKDRVIPRSRMHIMNMIGSIDGLVCITDNSSMYCDIIHVYNPIMGEFITVQTPGGGERKLPNSTTYGFGISSGKYHVVRIYEEINQDSTCHVYTIGDGVWKSIGHAPHLYQFSRRKNLFFKGSLHWLIFDKYGHEHICCLDLEKELFQPFLPLPELCQGRFATLNIYKGFLSVCDNTSASDLVIWVMKEYGVNNSWSKEVVISKRLIKVLGNYFGLVYIVKVFKDGEILLSWRTDDMLYSYHPMRKTLEKIDVRETTIGRFLIEATEYVSSIVSLKSLGEVNVYRT